MALFKQWFIFALVLSCATMVGCSTNSEPSCESAWGFYDEATGLCWQNPGLESCSMWKGAVTHCDTLTSGGHSDWRLPTISELRSLIRGCSDTMIGGACSVTDECLDFGPCYNDPCWQGCEYNTGPGVNGCFWDVAFDECYLADVMCSQACWSSSTLDSSDGNAWTVNFPNAGVYAAYKTDSAHIHCVRSVL